LLSLLLLLTLSSSPEKKKKRNNTEKEEERHSEKKNTQRSYFRNIFYVFLKRKVFFEIYFTWSFSKKLVVEDIIHVFQKTFSKYILYIQEFCSGILF